MLPLGLVLLVATAAPQQNAPQQNQSYELKSDFSKLRAQLQHRDYRLVQQSPLGTERKNTCYAIRSYSFRRQDGQAPVLVSTTTCTPASKLQQRQVKPEPGALYVPLAAPQQPSALQQLSPQQKQKLELAMREAEKSAKAAGNDLLYAKDNMCFTMRSYYFRRQDGQAPVLAGVSTCTPASKLQQRRVSPEPGELYVPLGLHSNDLQSNDQQPAK
jgi:hypothetical protein